MNDSGQKKRGRPSKKAREEWDWDNFKSAAAKSKEVFRSYSTPWRVRIACEQMERFLQSTGRQSLGVKRDCSNLSVFKPFVLSKLFEQDLCAEIGRWMNDENWDLVESWRSLCERWNYQWTLPARSDDQRNFTPAWRLACMVEGWRLLDEHYLRGWQDDSGHYPSVAEINDAAKKWIQLRGVPMTRSDGILGKAREHYAEIALCWIPRMELKKPPGCILSEEQLRAVVDKFSDAEWQEIGRGVSGVDPSSLSIRRIELNYLSQLDWFDDED